MRLYFGNTTSANRVQFTTPIASASAPDTTAPTFGGITSAADATTGGAANLSWTAATDPSTPIRYTVYAYQSATLPPAATLFQAGNIVQSNLTATSTTVTGLTNGLPYFFGARATDAADNTDTNTAIRPSAAPGVIPTGGGAGGGIVCGDCHAIPNASGSHAAHADSDTDYTECETCHGTVAGGYQTTPSGTHNDGSQTLAAGFSYSGGAAGTCTTTICHSPGTGTPTNSTTWGTAASLGCDECHYYSASPTGAANLAYGRPLSASHGDHFDNAKACTQCHGTLPTDAAHASAAGTDGAVLTSRANAGQDEATLNWAHASAVTDYTFGADNTCYSATNNGLGCHATGGAAGAADATRPDWDVAFASTACTNCHTNNTTAAVNPTSGLHGVVPSITARPTTRPCRGAGARRATR